MMMSVTMMVAGMAASAHLMKMRDQATERNVDVGDGDTFDWRRAGWLSCHGMALPVAPGVIVRQNGPARNRFRSCRPEEPA